MALGYSVVFVFHVLVVCTYKARVFPLMEWVDFVVCLSTTLSKLL
jgi:hypothetical protein